MSGLRSAPVPPLDDEDHVRGPQDAPLVVVYADFTCPRCAVAHARLRDQPLRVAFRHFALRSRHPRAPVLAAAAEAAAAQGAFWAVHDALYEHPGRTEDPDLWALVRRLGLDLDRFEEDRRSQGVADRVRRDVRAGVAAGITATPTLFSAAGTCSGAPDAGWLASVRERRPAG